MCETLSFQYADIYGSYVPVLCYLKNSRTLFSCLLYAVWVKQLYRNEVHRQHHPIVTYR